MRFQRSASRSVRGKAVLASDPFRVFFPLALALSAFLLLPRVIGAQNPPSVPMPETSSISVSAVGESTAVPDQAQILFWVQTRAATATEASRQNATLQEQVIRALRGAGIESRDLSTSGYSLSPDMQYDERERRARLVGYIARNGVQVRVRDIAKVGPLIDAAIAAGANEVGNLSFETSRAAELRRDALSRAVGNACRDAEVMARAAGGSLGRLLELSSSPRMQPPQPVYRMMAEANVAQDVATPIEPGELTVRSDVVARWEFLPAVSGDSRCG